MNPHNPMQRIDMSKKVRLFFVRMFTGKPACSVCLKKIKNKKCFNLGGFSQCIGCGYSMSNFYFFLNVFILEVEQVDDAEVMKKTIILDKVNELKLIDLNINNSEIYKREDYDTNNYFDESKIS